MLLGQGPLDVLEDPVAEVVRAERVLRVHRDGVAAGRTDLGHRAGRATGAVDDAPLQVGLVQAEHIGVLVQRPCTDEDIGVLERVEGGVGTCGHLGTLLKSAGPVLFRAVGSEALTRVPSETVSHGGCGPTDPGGPSHRRYYAKTAWAMRDHVGPDRQHISTSLGTFSP